MIAEPQVNNKRIIKNTLFLYLRMILLMSVSLYTSRIVLDKLGVEDYGIYNIVGGVIFLFSFISGPMTEATQRFLNYYMGINDVTEVRKVFNASQMIHLCIAIIILLLAETIGLWFVCEKIVMPEERYYAALWAYHFSVFSSVFLFLSFPYNAIIIAHEKMSVFAGFSIAEALSKMGVAFLLSMASFDRLILYSALMMVVQITISLLYRFYCIIHFCEVKFCISNISKDLYKQIISFSGWNFIGNLANVCLMQGTNILLNLFFGPVVNAARGVSIQVMNAINQLCNNFQMAMRPQIIKSYAANEFDDMHVLIFRASKFSYFLVFILALPIMIKADWILSIWLKEVPEFASIFVQYTLAFALVQALANPLLTGSIATGKVKTIMSTIAVFFIMIVPICYLALYLGCSPISVFQIQLVMYIIAHIMRVFIVGNQIHFNKIKYAKVVICPIIYVSSISFVVAICIDWLIQDSFSLNVFTLSTIFIITVMIIGILGFTSEEKAALLDFVKTKFKHINTNNSK